MHKLIEKQPTKRQLIFKLSRYEHKSHKEIASQLDISVKTVENQIGSVIKHLRSKIDTIQ